MSNRKNNPDEFVPPFCPRDKCLQRKTVDENWRYKKSGTYRAKKKPKRIQRFTCKTCKGTFSEQTFAQDYWQKLPDIDAKLIDLTVGCMSNRQAANALKVSPTTVNRHLSRLARHCMLYHAEQMQSAEPVTDVVIDGLVTFEWSQYFPVHVHTAVEKGTDFFPYFTESPVRRSGCMTEEQEDRREELEEKLGVPDPRAVDKDVRELRETVLGSQKQAVVHSDKLEAYRQVIKKLPVEILHLVTSSRDHRGNNNDLWEINLLDANIRHYSANHKRETIAWSKRRQMLAERMVIFLVWRNYMRGRRVKMGQRSATPAMARGMLDHRVKEDELLERRLFRQQVALPKRWAQYYDGLIETAALEVNRRHELSYAY